MADRIWRRRILVRRWLRFRFKGRLCSIHAGFRVFLAWKGAWVLRKWALTFELTELGGLPLALWLNDLLGITTRAHYHSARWDAPKLVQKAWIEGHRIE
jgi:hypothetical protein